MRNSRLLAVALGGFLATTPLLAQEHPHVAKGFAPDKAFAVGDVDSINTFNGNLVLTVPIGPQFPLREGFSYGLRLVSNSNIWDAKAVLGPPDSTINRISTRFNAGVGWRLSLGELIPPTDLERNQSARWIYAGADGAEHWFFDKLHPSDPEDAGDTMNNQKVLYSRDGSYLRLKHQANSRVVEMPDGTQHIFGLDNVLQRIQDRFGNYLELQIQTSPTNVVWNLSDSQGRFHVVSFTLARFDQEIRGGSSVPLFRPILSNVSLSGYQGASSVWSFEYTQKTDLPRACPDCPGNPLNDGTTPNLLSVPFLTRIVQPDGASWDAPLNSSYILTSNANPSDQVGKIKRLTLPTRGSLEWDYGFYRYPEETERAPRISSNLGVTAKRRVREDGSVEGQWTYTPKLVLEPQQIGQIPPRVEMYVTERTPLDHYIRHYYSVYPRVSEYTPIPTATALAYGLPFTPKTTDAGVPLSRRIWDCDPDGPPRNGQPAVTACLLRSVYMDYQRDQFEGVFTFSEEQVGTYMNPRSFVERTVFHDDTAGGFERFIQTSRGGFDGLGHYRSATTTSNFENTPQRSEQTNYNPARGTYQLDAGGNPQPGYNALGSGGAWVLENFSFMERSEGGQSSLVEYCYDANTGYVARKRIHSQNSPAIAANDIVIDYIPELRPTVGTQTGNVARENFYGGDRQSVALSGGQGTCGQSLLQSTAQYARRHTYSGGVRDTSRWINGAGADMSFKTLDLTIDVPSGLPSSSRDVSGLQTNYVYDGMFRKTAIRPQAGHGAWTEIAYIIGGGSTPPRIELRSRANGSVAGTPMAESEVKFDGFGRVSLERLKMPGNVWSTKTTTYDGAGNVATVSERESGIPSHDTKHQNYDPFGRAWRIRPADGLSHDIIIGYAGIRRMTRTSKIWRLCNPGDTAPSECSTDVSENYDAYGRLVQVQDRSGAGDTVVNTAYDYDVGDRLRGVTMGAQSRTFNYDRRGFLLSETHPEKGASGNGSVTYSSYDPLGNPGQRIDGAHDVSFVRDRAGRLTEVWENPAAAPSRMLKEWKYGTSPDSTNWTLGKVTEQSRWNYVIFSTPPTSTPYTVRLRETFLYAGRGGALSYRLFENYAHLTSGSPPATPSESFEQGWTYDDLGNVLTVDYPRCLHSGCLPVQTPRTVTNFYTQGFLTGVLDWASSITYNPNFTVSTVVHSNTVIDEITNDPVSIARPRKIEAKLGTSTLWSSGDYNYDGSGNIKSIGTWAFQYDGVNRLTRARQHDGQLTTGTQREQTYVYDRFGNLTEMRAELAGTPGRMFSVSTATNRLNAAGVVYDASGNLTRWNGVEYEFDALDRMWKMKNGAEEWYYLYTADDERAWSFKQGGTLSRWTMRGLGGEVLREYEANTLTGTWTLSEDFIYRGAQLLAAETPLGRRHFSLDHLGSPRLVTAKGGKEEAYHVYYPYGEELTAVNQDTHRLKFTGHERDLANPTSQADDLDYMHARFYSPLTGRFLGVDMVPGRPDEPQSWNRYPYTAGNPSNFVDPDGHLRLRALQGIGGATGFNVDFETTKWAILLRTGIEKGSALVPAGPGKDGINIDKWARRLVDTTVGPDVGTSDTLGGKLAHAEFETEVRDAFLSNLGSEASSKLGKEFAEAMQFTEGEVRAIGDAVKTVANRWYDSGKIDLEQRNRLLSRYDINRLIERAKKAAETKQKQPAPPPP